MGAAYTTATDADANANADADAGTATTAHDDGDAAATTSDASFRGRHASILFLDGLPSCHPRAVSWTATAAISQLERRHDANQEEVRLCDAARPTLRATSGPDRCTSMSTSEPEGRLYF